MVILERTDILSATWLRVPAGARRRVGRFWLRSIQGGKGGGETTTTVVSNVPPKSQEELDLMKKQNDLLDIQIAELKRQNEALVSVFPEQKKLLEAQTQAATAMAEAQKVQTGQIAEIAAAQVPLIEKQIVLQTQQVDIATRTAKTQEDQFNQLVKALGGTTGEPLTPEQQRAQDVQKEIQRVSNERLLAQLKGEASPLSDEQKRQITDVFNRAQERGTTDLRRFGEELAASRGLKLTDTPVASELLRQEQELSSNLRAAQSGAELNVGQSQEQFDLAVEKFQQDLANRAFQNRLALTGNTTGASGGTAGFLSLPGGMGATPAFASTNAGATTAAINQLLSTMANERIAGASRTQTTEGPGITGPNLLTAGTSLFGSGIEAAGASAPVWMPSLFGSGAAAGGASTIGTAAILAA